MTSLVIDDWWLGKAQTLRRLAPYLRGAKVDPGHLVSSDDWRRAPAAVLADLAEFIAVGPVIVRSSAPYEDTAGESLAGHYPSIVVPTGAVDQLHAGINVVFASYEPHPDAEVLLQRWINDPVMTAVVTTRVAGSGAPYVVLALDFSGRTDAITAGAVITVAPWYVARSAREFATVPPEIRMLLRCATEVEQVTGTDAVDVEVALTRSGQLMLLQARPLVVPEASTVLERAAAELRGQITTRVAADPHRVWSCMADWNPAEMIGVRPTPLAFALYQWAITESTWAVQRRQYGYRDLTGVPLMIDLGGKPYIDVAASLASFVPADTDEATATAVVQAQLALLRERPDRHDKIEFEIAATCLTPAFADRVHAWSDHGVTAAQINRIKAGLARITAAAIVRLPQDLATLRESEARRLSSQPDPLATGRALLARAREAALLFAHLARAAFIATDLLRGLVAVDVINATDRDAFLSGIETVPARMRRHGAAVAAGQMSWDEFVTAWGHLRPGTYDVRVPRYATDPDRYLGHFIATGAVAAPADGARPSPWPTSRARRVERALATSGLPVDSHELAVFCRHAIGGREDAKNTYSRVISAALEAFAAAGAQVGLDRADVTWLDLAELARLSEPGATAELAERVEARRARHVASLLVCLPDCLWETGQVAAFPANAARPTFVGTGRVVGPPIPIDVEDLRPGVVVLAEAADPGHDWIFGGHIGGLVTAYGGANSHMAVRCAELGIPAALGVGADRFTALAAAHRIELDPGAATLRILP